MASTSTEPTDSNRKGYTPPKGRPTRRSGDIAARRGLSPTIEWIIVIMVLIAIFGAIFYFGREIGDHGGGVSNGAALPLARAVAATVGA